MRLRVRLTPTAGTNRIVKRLIDDNAQRPRNDALLHERELPHGRPDDMAERMRNAGAGLGGFLTPTGGGTEIAEGQQEFEIDGKRYILEKPLRGDFALIKALKADKRGNLVYRKSARNFNPVMAMAAEMKAPVSMPWAMTPGSPACSATASL